jgi:hypothetical protein
MLVALALGLTIVLEGREVVFYVGGVRWFYGAISRERYVCD